MDAGHFSGGVWRCPETAMLDLESSRLSLNLSRGLAGGVPQRGSALSGWLRALPHVAQAAEVAHARCAPRLRKGLAPGVHRAGMPRKGRNTKSRKVTEKKAAVLGKPRSPGEDEARMSARRCGSGHKGWAEKTVNNVWAVVVIVTGRRVRSSTPFHGGAAGSRGPSGSSGSVTRKDRVYTQRGSRVGGRDKTHRQGREGRRRRSSRQDNKVKKRNGAGKQSTTQIRGGQENCTAHRQKSRIRADHDHFVFACRRQWGEESPQ